MRHYLFIILAIIALSACNLATNLGTDGASIGFNDDEAENTGNINTGGDNRVTDNTGGDNTNGGAGGNNNDVTNNDARPTDINFTSFDAVPVDTGTITIDGIGKQLTYILGNYGDVWDSGDEPTLSLIYDNGRISAMTLWNDTHVTNFTKQYVTIDVFNIFGGVAIDNVRAYVTMLNPARNNWKYQTYIRWEYWIGSEYANNDASESSSDNHKEITHSWVGIASIGSETLGANIPTNGTVSFSEEGVRYAGDASDSNKFHSSAITITAIVNFNDREVALVSRYSDDTDYFTGTLTYNNASNDLSGVIVWVGDNSSATGTAEARFYGPAAEEFGGTFELGSNHFGAFGAKREE
ncbi:MAG: transferrin-binding protein-like solute binding protein [Alphaproteobacteria bacterium]|nr:transferrin-binding protein-like solute binding protein [Alphaproteobacteria bacterium]